MDRKQLENIIREEILREDVGSGLARMVAGIVNKYTSGALEEKKEKSSVVHKSTSKGHKYIGRAFKGKSAKDREKTMKSFAHSMREMIREILKQAIQEEVKDENNPWAICTASVGRKDKEKYESCVKKVKKQYGAK